MDAPAPTTAPPPATDAPGAAATAPGDAPAPAPPTPDDGDDLLAPCADDCALPARHPRAPPRPMEAYAIFLKTAYAWTSERLKKDGKGDLDVLEAIEDGVIESDAAAAWHVESAKAKAAGKLPGDLSSVNEHLIRARKILIADGDILAHMEEISLMLQALELRLRTDALKKAAAEAGTFAF